jgi:hypothetical protein
MREYDVVSTYIMVFRQVGSILYLEMKAKGGREEAELLQTIIRK